MKRAARLLAVAAMGWLAMKVGPSALDSQSPLRGRVRAGQVPAGRARTVFDEEPRP